jgi:hypothetical protein
MHSEGGADAWGNEAPAESTEAPAPVEASGWGAETSQAPPTPAGPTVVPPTLASSDFGAPQGPPAPPAQVSVFLLPLLGILRAEI